MIRELTGNGRRDRPTGGSAQTQFHRLVASEILEGNGLEIGALHEPFNVNERCAMQYLDVKNTRDLELTFSELNGKKIVDIDYVGDVCKQPVREITGKQFDFIVMNHVLEHVANPIKVLEHVVSGIRTDGYLVISVPDKNNSYDKNRNITYYEHLLADYYLDVSDACDDHYVDFLASVHPETFASRDTFLAALQSNRERREHVHVWDSATFREALTRALKCLRIDCCTVFESHGQDNGVEYFAVVKKGHGYDKDEVALKVLRGMYKYRDDLKKIFTKNEECCLKDLCGWAMAHSQRDTYYYVISDYVDNYRKLYNNIK